MDKWKHNNRMEVIMTDIEGLVPKNHLLRKIERVMDYEWIYERPNHITVKIMDVRERIR